MNHSSFLNKLSGEDEIIQKILTDLIIQACDGKVHKRNNYQPDFNPPNRWKQQINGLLGIIGYESNDITRAANTYLSIQFDYNGSCHLFCGRAGEKRINTGNILIFPELIADITVRFSYLVSRLFEKVDYIGMVDFGIGITGIQDGIVYSNDLMIQYTRSPYEYDTYKRTGRFSNLVILDDPKQVAEYLVMPFIKAISQNRINPFKNPSNKTN